MADRTKKSHIVFLSALTVVVCMLIGGLVWDYYNYNHDYRTVLFHQKLNYTASQSVPLGNLIVSGASLTVEPLSKQQVTGYKSIWSLTSNPIDTYKAKEASLRVMFTLKNNTSQAIDMNEYHFEVQANTDINHQSNTPTIKQLLPHSTVELTYTGYFDNAYTGPIALSVRHHSVSKAISLR